MPIIHTPIIRTINYAEWIFVARYKCMHVCRCCDIIAKEEWSSTFVYKMYMKSYPDVSPYPDIQSKHCALRGPDNRDSTVRKCILTATAPTIKNPIRSTLFSPKDSFRSCQVNHYGYAGSQVGATHSRNMSVEDGEPTCKLEQQRWKKKESKGKYFGQRKWPCRSFRRPQQHLKLM